jgi:hypothetical protein
VSQHLGIPLSSYPTKRKNEEKKFKKQVSIAEETHAITETFS